MATSDQEQKSVLVKQHKRIAMGEKLNGQSMQAKGGTSQTSKRPSGGLSGAKKSNA
jgi:hypothetical protein